MPDYFTTISDVWKVLGLTHLVGIPRLAIVVAAYGWHCSSHISGTHDTPVHAVRAPYMRPPEAVPSVAAVLPPPLLLRRLLRGGAPGSRCRPVRSLAACQEAD